MATEDISSCLNFLIFTVLLSVLIQHEINCLLLFLHTINKKTNVAVFT